MSKRNILVLSDSHGVVFNSVILKILFPKHRFRVTQVNGATISGIENPNSKTQALDSFEKALEKNKDCQKCVLLLGEVDTGFVLWYKHEQDGSDMDNLLDKTQEKFVRLINKVAHSGYEPIIVSTPLPTIKDGNIWGEIANKRKIIKANQIERTKLTIKFNNRVCRSVEKLGCTYLSLDDICLSRSTGTIKNYFRHPNKTNHHYNKFVYTIVLWWKFRGKI
jgi:hypothetical protein